MTGQIAPADVERFRAALVARFGLWFDDGKFEFLATVLDRRLRCGSDSAAGYLVKLESRAVSAGELRELAQELTVGETYFFRHADQFRAFSEVALPARVEARAVSKQLRFLSAGCSSGEEAFSLSILARRQLGNSPYEITIRGVDINPKVLERARAARYSPWALRETPEEFQRQYFDVEGRDHVLSKAIRDSVQFDEENLVADDSWVPESYDVIFCRNVLMYFTPEQAQRVVKRFARALAPGGYLFLGHAENLRGLSLAFDLRHTHATFYYQRRAASAELAQGFERTELPESPPRSLVTSNWTSTWLDTVQRSSDRIRALTESSLLDSSPEAALEPPRTARLDLSLALELLSHERFTEALEVLARLPVSAAKDPDTVLLRAALLTHSGHLEAAELACSELLALDGLSAGAHYLRSLCRERQADTRAATEHAQIASYLDPSFAMPHLHLGLIARRTGDRATAQRELTQAALLLKREDASRLLLFGGGFSREGLVALCQSELTRLGGPL